MCHQCSSTQQDMEECHSFLGQDRSFPQGKSNKHLSIVENIKCSHKHKLEFLSRFTFINIVWLLFSLSKVTPSPYLASNHYQNMCHHSVPLTQSFCWPIGPDVTLGLFDSSLQTVVARGADVTFDIVGRVGDIRALQADVASTARQTDSCKKTVKSVNKNTGKLIMDLLMKCQIPAVPNHTQFTIFGAVCGAVTSWATDLAVCHVDISRIDGHCA